MDFSPSFPHAVYTETVLRHNFEDAKQWFLTPLLLIHRAHAVMLAECGILPVEEAATLLRALEALDLDALRETPYDGTREDLFFHIEDLLAAACGPDVAGKLHTARSRNDIDITLYRMVLRQEILAISGDLAGLRMALLKVAEAHVDSVMPAYTHTQPAQPTTLAHYLLGILECLQRDAARLRAAWGTVNRNPLGACAITTTGFPIDRDRTAELLGFEGLQENSIGAIAAVDYVAETLSALATCALGLGKFTQDLLLWCTQEFGFLRVGDAWAQISSIMPQKRNPVAYEHARILLSRAFAQSHAAIACCHNTPFGDIVDSEDDLWPAVFRATEDTGRALRLLSALIPDTAINRARMAELAGSRFITVTELADTLVREGGLSFRQAHQLVAGAVKAAETDRPDAIVKALEELAPRILGAALPLTAEAAKDALDPRNFVARRGIAGGPSPAAVREALARARECAAADLGWIDTRTKGLRSAEQALTDCCRGMETEAARSRA